MRLRLKREQIETNLETWRCRQPRRNRKAKKEETTMMKQIRQMRGNNNQPQTKGDEEYGDIRGQGVTQVRTIKGRNDNDTHVKIMHEGTRLSK